SLEQTTIAPQQTDAFQWNIGNPELKTASSYSLNLGYNFTVPRVSGTFGIKALTSPNAIAPCIHWVDNMLVSSFENSKGFRSLSFYLSPSIDVIPGWFTIAGNIQYSLERMRGGDYTIDNNHFSGYGVAIVRHWGFSLMASYQKNRVALLGETKERYETVSIVALSYDWKNFQFSAGVFCPFGDYDRGTESFNKYLAYDTRYHLDIAPMPIINIRYNIQWGKQKRGIHKNATTNASAEKSTTTGR
ncbi:MAG: outer membrane beta-barrel family protein, partial [Muribaculaceae bacterium]|nr:outer membrane beta-barrel family protein [Muribaculaceae bacterium]